MKYVLISSLPSSEFNHCPIDERKPPLSFELCSSFSDIDSCDIGMSPSCCLFILFGVLNEDRCCSDIRCGWNDTEIGAWDWNASDSSPTAANATKIERRKLRIFLWYGSVDAFFRWIWYLSAWCGYSIRAPHTQSYGSIKCWLAAFRTKNQKPSSKCFVKPKAKAL